MTPLDPARMLKGLEEAKVERIQVAVASDGLSAFVTIQAGEASSVSQLADALTRTGVVFGVDEHALAQLGMALVDPAYEVKAELVARGRAVMPGQDAQLIPHFHPGIQAGSVSDDGTMDFHDRELLKPVTAEEVIATVVAAVPGMDGRRVDGEVIACAEVAGFTLTLGSKVRLDSEGVIVALEPGVVLYKAGQSLDVVQHYLHPSDVDLRSGDLEMPGTMLVKGSVRQSFQVTCTGDVEIQGGVEGGNIRAGGNVHVKLGISGSDSAFVEAAGSLAAKHAENARLHAGDLLKLEEATGCELNARRIEVTRGLRGGTANAEHSLVAGQLGNAHSATDTLIVIGEPLASPVGDAQRRLDQAKAERLAQRRSFAPRGFGQGARQKGGKLGREQASFAESELLRKVERIKQRDQLLWTAFVQVQGTIHPGVKLQMGEASISFAELTHATRFTFDPETRCIRSERPT